MRAAVEHLVDCNREQLAHVDRLRVRLAFQIDGTLYEALWIQRADEPIQPRVDNAIGEAPEQEGGRRHSEPAVGEAISSSPLVGRQVCVGADEGVGMGVDVG
eukprot:CAMPEP_0174732786 /NCGR_PEP_ID=MMETSP1094-20130205/60029_1 /TAXON_ID=156173 /ORGANISM="Chrysochromulina brevifilum, Strain UTEX LB 985" /LENGTH=101 /DNA_ID=CAMNT_0015935339 /DNA_START=565 /DNA_END=867 /DNA_ORIENTATION=+